MREFGIYFCVEDSTFTIHEIRFPNSGFIGGRFLRPYKAINPDTHKPYTASEVAYGREVVINSWRFRLEDPTDGAMKLTETRPSGPTVYELVNTIKHSIGGRLHKIEAEFAKFDPGGHGVVKRAVALELLTTAGLALSTAEWTLLFAHYKGANAALFPYAELLNDLR
jgi:hypothetical protein